VSNYLPIEIEQVWQEIFMVLRKGNAFSKFLGDEGCKGKICVNNLRVSV
jgi:hypothetical protein